MDLRDYGYGVLKRMLCSKCGSELLSGVKFRGQCGAPAVNQAEEEKDFGRQAREFVGDRVARTKEFAKEFADDAFTPEARATLKKAAKVGGKILKVVSWLP